MKYRQGDKWMNRAFREEGIVTVHSPVGLRFPVCPGWLMRGFQFKFRG